MSRQDYFKARLPLLIGSVAVLALAVATLVTRDRVFAPLAAFELAGFALGYLLRRWWWPLVPAAIAFTLAWALFTHDSPCPSGDECGYGDFLAAVALAIYGVVVALTSAAGVLVRRLSDRTAATSLRRRSS